MDLTSQSQGQLQLKPAPPGTAIQVGADMIMALIESERINIELSVRDQLQKLQQLVYTSQQDAINARAACQAQVTEAHQKLFETQNRMTQLQQAYSAQTTTQDNQDALRAELYRTSVEAIEAQEKEAKAIQQLNELRNALQRIGIAFCSEEKSLKFEAEWGVVLAELENHQRGHMNPEQLHEMLGGLAQKLQSDRETITHLKRELLSSNQEREKVISDYEKKLASLKLQVSTTHDAAAASQHLDVQPESSYSHNQYPANTLPSPPVKYTNPYILPTWGTLGNEANPPEQQELNGNVTTDAHSPLRFEVASLSARRIDLRNIRQRRPV